MLFGTRAVDEQPLSKDYTSGKAIEKGPGIRRITREALEYLAKEDGIAFTKDTTKEELYAAVYGGDS